MLLLVTQLQCLGLGVCSLPQWSLSMSQFSTAA